MSENARNHRGWTHVPPDNDNVETCPCCGVKRRRSSSIKWTRGYKTHVIIYLVPGAKSWTTDRPPCTRS